MTRNVLRLSEGDYGKPDDATFVVPWELWAQLRMMLVNAMGIKIASDGLAPIQAVAMGRWLEAQKVGTPSMPIFWSMHLHLWGDDGGSITAQLAQFLLRGEIDLVQAIENPNG
jgi:hypothetical protein